MKSTRDAFNEPSTTDRALARRRLLASWRKKPGVPGTWNGLMGQCLPHWEPIEHGLATTRMEIHLWVHYPQAWPTVDRLKRATQITASMKRVDGDDDLHILSFHGNSVRVDFLVHALSVSFTWAAGYWAKDACIPLVLPQHGEASVEKIVNLRGDASLIGRMHALHELYLRRPRRAAEDKFKAIRVYDDVSRTVSELAQPSGGFLFGLEGDEWKREMNRRYFATVSRH